MAIADRQEKPNLFCRVGNDLGAGLDEVGQAHHREPHRRGPRCVPVPDGSPSSAAQAFTITRQHDGRPALACLSVLTGCRAVPVERKRTI